jgi:hypothetical protein
LPSFALFCELFLYGTMGGLGSRIRISLYPDAVWSVDPGLDPEQLKMSQKRKTAEHRCFEETDFIIQEPGSPSMKV